MVCSSLYLSLYKTNSLVCVNPMIMVSWSAFEVGRKAEVNSIDYFVLGVLLISYKI